MPQIVNSVDASSYFSGLLTTVRELGKMAVLLKSPSELGNAVERVSTCHVQILEQYVFLLCGL